MPATIFYLINALAAGGSERQLIYLLGGLDRTRFEPVVCTVFDDLTHPPHPAYVKQLDDLKIQRLTLAHKSGWSGRIAALQRLIGMNWRLRPAIVHSFLHYANLLSRAASPFSPVHTLYTTARGEFLPGEIRSEAYTWWLDRQLICNAPHIREQVLRYTRRPPQRVRVIPNGIPVSEFLQNPDPNLRHRLFGKASFVLGYVGRIASKKNIPTLIEALTYLPMQISQDMRVFIVGEVSEPDVLKVIEQMLQQYQLQSIVQRISAVDDVRPFYHAADLLVLPSQIEGMPNVVMEACAAGTPVIASEGANRAGLVKDGVNGWQFQTGDAKALAALIEQAYYLSPERRFTMSQQARKVSEEYSVQAMVERYTELYTLALK